MIRVTVDGVKYMPYDMLIQMESGKEALDKYGPVFSRDKKPKAWLASTTLVTYPKNVPKR